ncbi:MAG TPA: GTPase, partial [Candidatus Saccharimonadales bacterium]|nr:GTPase [Candidatus Saccharimonadales bacterium]
HIAALAPSDQPPLLKLALLGRPNVGKSSILNALCGRSAAIVSEQAGTTRDVRTISLKAHGQNIHILDTAGLRRRGKIVPGTEKFSTIRTAQAIASADICALIMDATELGVAGDQHIAGMVKEAGKGLILVVNKWDAVERDDKTQAHLSRALARDLAFVGWAPLVFTSATTNLHIRQLLELATQIHTRRNQTLATGPLNRVVEDLVRAHPPAGLKGIRPKINYATQTGTNPPEVTFFTSHPRAIHFSYLRYLENGLRSAYDFIGTPIKLEFRSKRDKL